MQNKGVLDPLKIFGPQATQIIINLTPFTSQPLAYLTSYHGVVVDGPAGGYPTPLLHR